MLILLLKLPVLLWYHLVTLLITVYIPTSLFGEPECSSLPPE